MHKYKTNIFLFIANIMMCSLMFMGCNENDIEKREINKNATDSLYNVNNPYDTYGIELKNTYSEFANFIQNHVETEESIYQEDLNNFMSTISNPYPNISDDMLQKFDTTYILNLFKSFNRELRLYGLKQASLSFENNILQNIGDNALKQCYLLFISQLKYNIYYSDAIIMQFAAPSWGERFDNCMYNELYNLEHGSELLFAQYIAGLPATFVATVASCTYMATFRPNHELCIEKKGYNDVPAN